MFWKCHSSEHPHELLECPGTGEKIRNALTGGLERRFPDSYSAVLRWRALVPGGSCPGVKHSAGRIKTPPRVYQFKVKQRPNGELSIPESPLNKTTTEKNI